MILGSFILVLLTMPPMGQAPGLPLRGGCVDDAAVVVHDMRTNYAGAHDAERRLGSDVLEKAAERLRSRALTASDSACDAVIREFLSIFEDRHISLRSDLSHPDDERGSRPAFPCCTPSVSALGADVAVIHLPSFSIDHRASLERLLAEHLGGLLARPYWVVDVRGNRGGGNATYAALLDLISTGPIIRHGTSFLSTSDNRARWRAALEQIPESEVEVRAEVRAVIDALELADGSYVEVEATGTRQLGNGLPSLAAVALLADRWCASACDSFVLEASQSRRVTFVGEETYWVVDYSNLLPSELPSGLRSLRYPSSRSHRLDGDGPSGRPEPDVRFSATLLSDYEGARREAARLIRRARSAPRPGRR